MRVYDQLDHMHSWRGWHWWPDGDPFEVIVGTILVQNTSWTNVERALLGLKKANVLSPQAMRSLGTAELEQLVRPSGQYRQKAKKLQAFLELTEQAGGLKALLSKPMGRLRPLLLATWGIGEETADAIVLYAARQPSFVIDAYTIRLFGRLSLGPVDSSNYAVWKTFFEEELDEAEPSARRDLWARYHALVVMHCKHLCRKRGPKCNECLLAADCPAAEVRT